MEMLLIALIIVIIPGFDTNENEFLVSTTSRDYISKTYWFCFAGHNPNNIYKVGIIILENQPFFWFLFIFMAPCFWALQ
jgi:hypothetical protein